MSNISRFVIFACIATTTATAQTSPAVLSPDSITHVSRFRFAGLSWGSDEKAVVDSMRRQGLQLAGPDADGDLYFKGLIINERALVTAGMAGQRLARVTVVLTPPNEVAIRVYRDVLRTLRNRYGDPTQQIAAFEAPYAEGDGQELAALLAGKATLAARWDTVQEGESLRIALTNTPSIVLFYENGPVWKAEEARRKQRAGANP